MRKAASWPRRSGSGDGMMDRPRRTFLAIEVMVLGDEKCAANTARDALVPARLTGIDDFAARSGHAEGLPSGKKWSLG